MNFLNVVLLRAFIFVVIFENINCQYDDSPEVEDYFPKLKDGDHFDFIVVGSGSAGGVVGSRLAENPDWNILVLDAGADPPGYTKFPGFNSYLLTSKEAWTLKSEPSDSYCLSSKNQQCQLTRSRVFGGGSTISNMVYQRGVPRDFEIWTDAGNQGWDWENVLEYYKKSENNVDFGNNTRYHGNKGPLTVIKRRDLAEDNKVDRDFRNTLKDLGIRIWDDLYDGSGYTGYGVLQTLNDGKRRSSVFENYLKPADKKPNFHLAGNAHVSKILIGEGPKALGVEILSRNNVPLNIFANKEVVISAGSLNTPKILQLSGIGPKEDLEKIGIKVIKDLPVGKNLQDNIAVWGLFIKLGDRDPIPAKALQNDVGKEIWKNLTGTLEGAGVDYTGIVPLQNGTYPDVQVSHMFHSLTFGDDITDWAGSYDFNDEIINFYKEISKRNAYISPLPFQYNPKSRGFVKLRSSNPIDPPSVTMNYLSNPFDTKILLDAITYIQNFFHNPHFSNLHPEFVSLTLPNPDNLPLNSPQYWEYFIRNMGVSMLHYAGTCKMGPLDDKSSVVDDRLKVHGVEGLRVIDASIMPTMVTGNPVMSVVMIGEKGADLIKEDYV